MQHWAHRTAGDALGQQQHLKAQRKEEIIQPTLLEMNTSAAVLKPGVQFIPHLVTLVVESDPGHSGVARTSEAEDLLGVTPLKHPHATILSSRQI